MCRKCLPSAVGRTSKADAIRAYGDVRALINQYGHEGVWLWDLHTPINLINDVQSLPASSWKALGLPLPYTGTLSVTVEVTKGNPVDVFVMDEANLQNLKNNVDFRHFVDFGAMESRTYKRSARMNQGVYYLVLRDKTLGILSARNSDVKVMARLEP
jgi:hypothetical protein